MANSNNVQKRYDFQDPIRGLETRYPHLYCSRSSKPILIILRILSGTIKCADNYLKRETPFTVNYFKLPFQQLTQRQLKQSVLLNLFDGITLRDLNAFVQNSTANHKFFERLQHEFIKCLIARNSESYLEAFIYLYRIVECIGYAFPLIYTSKANEYVQTYKLLQELFVGADRNAGELGFFKSFLERIYGQEDFFKLTIDINFGTIEIDEIREKYYGIVYDKCKDKDKKTAIKDQIENEEIKLSFIGFYESLIEIRNRYFHLLQGSWQKNIDSVEVLYPELFFKPLIDPGINWVAIVTLEIIKHNFARTKI